MNYNRVSHNLDAIRADGVAIAANETGAPSTYGLTLAAGTTYYLPFGADRAPTPAEVELIAVHLRWDNAIAMTISFGMSIFPSFSPSDMSSGIVDVSDIDTTLGNWLPLIATAANASVIGGATYSTVTGAVTVAAGQQGGALLKYQNYGARRGRIAIAVGATGGIVRAAVHGKNAA